MVVIREQTEGEYSALEHESIPGVVECLKVVTKEKSRRIAKFAFDYATRYLNFFFVKRETARGLIFIAFFAKLGNL